MLKKLAGDKHSSFLQKVVNYGQKFYNIGPRPSTKTTLDFTGKDLQDNFSLPVLASVVKLLCKKL
jgi:hypothetical protein